MPEQDDVLLSVENLYAYYTSKRGVIKAVEDVSFYIRHGETLGLFGESGAGKTSVALSILGIFDQVSRYQSSLGSDKEQKKLWKLKDKARKEGLTSKDMGVTLPGVEGHIWFKGEDLVGMDEEEYRKIRGYDITYIPQGTRKAMNPYTPIDLQTAESLIVHDEDNILPERFILRRVLEVLDLVELADVDTRKKQKPGQFSQGEDQRILIAMALITNPDLLIMDEPTTAVDVGVQRRILEAIDLVKKNLDIGILLISNDQGVIAEMSDRVAVMTGGRIVEFGDAERVLKHPGHPFTRAFVMSNPTMEIMRRIREKGLVLRGIPGEPPDMADPPSGCVFHPRCDYCIDICSEKVPEYREVDEDYWVFCHRYEELPEF
ncbi:ABC transporter ATP-binding protein [Candidatus Thorarchaeota archaeon]|nr:MAG: ABC transporter ATP-binding protein [Candidatus Thorarchaeota archaeon]